MEEICTIHCPTEHLARTRDVLVATKFMGKIPRGCLKSRNIGRKFEKYCRIDSSLQGRENQQLESGQYEIGQACQARPSPVPYQTATH